MKYMLPLLFVLLLACNKKESEITQNCDSFELATANLPNAEDLNVYLAILDNYFSGDKLPLVAQQTGGDVDSALVNDIVDNDQIIAHVNTIADYDAANDREYQLSPDLPPYSLIAEAELDCFFSSGGGYYEAFYDKYPNADGFVRFFRPGYHPDGDKVLLEYAHYYHSLGAEGYLITLEKRSGIWQVNRRLLIWIS